MSYKLRNMMDPQKRLNETKKYADACNPLCSGNGSTSEDKRQATMRAIKADSYTQVAS